MFKIKKSVFKTAHLPLCFQKIMRSATKSIVMHSAEVLLLRECHAIFISFVYKNMSPTN